MFCLVSDKRWQLRMAVDRDSSPPSCRLEQQVFLYLIVVPQTLLQVRRLILQPVFFQCAHGPASLPCALGDQHGWFQDWCNTCCAIHFSQLRSSQPHWSVARSSISASAEERLCPCVILRQGSNVHVSASCWHLPCMPFMCSFWLFPLLATLTTVWFFMHGDMMVTDVSKAWEWSISLTQCCRAFSSKCSLSSCVCCYL